MKKTISILLTIMMCLQCVGCNFINSATSVFSNAKNTVIEWYENIDTEKFENGWEYMAEKASSAYSVIKSSQYAMNIADKIKEFNNIVNNTYRHAGNIAQEAGYLAEKWTAYTFNINAVANNSSESAKTVNSNGLGSVDVQTTYGEEVSLKFYNSGSASAQAQAKTYIEAYRDYASKAENPMSLGEYADQKGFDYQTQEGLLSSIYSNQTRIIPSNQIEEAINFLEGRIEKLSSIDGDTASARTKSYQETLQNLKDRISAPDGTESTPFTQEQMQAAAELAKDGKFDYTRFGIKPSQILPPKYILKQAIGTGLTASLLRTAITIGPDLVSVLIDSIKNNEIDEAKLKEIGIDGLLSASEGFAIGSISSAITAMCQGGYFGTDLINADPSIVATLTILTIDAIRYGYYLAKGEISAEDYGNLMAEKILISAITIPTAYMITTLLGGSQIATMAGCMAGSIIATAGLSITKNIVLEIKDGGGFVAIVPKGLINTIDVAKETIKNLDLKEKVSLLKDYLISTTADGLIYIQNKMSN